jgi:hypothetical protein
MLKQFGLDAPLANRELRNQFSLETNCITSLFMRCFQNTQRIKKFWKVLVEVVDVIEEAKSRDLLGAATIQVAGDVHMFSLLPGAEKKKRALEYLMAGVTAVAKEKGWEMRDFELAYNCVLARGFVNEWTWKRPIANKSRTATAEVHIEHDITEAHLLVRFRDRNKTIIKVKPLVSGLPSEFVFYAYLGKLRWLDDMTVELISREGDDTRLLYKE